MTVKSKKLSSKNLFIKFKQKITTLVTMPLFVLSIVSAGWHTSAMAYDSSANMQNFNNAINKYNRYHRQQQKKQALIDLNNDLKGLHDSYNELQRLKAEMNYLKIQEQLLKAEQENKNKSRHSHLNKKRQNKCQCQNSKPQKAQQKK